MESGEEVLISFLAVGVVAEVNVVFAAEPSGACFFPGVSGAVDGDEFALVLGGHGFGGHNVAFVSDTAAPLVGSFRVGGGAYDDDVVVLADSAFHECGKLVAGMDLPLVERDVDAVVTELDGELPDPFSVPVAFPGVGEEGAWCGSCRFHCWRHISLIIVSIVS